MCPLIADRGASSSLLSDDEALSKADRFLGGPAGCAGLRGERLRERERRFLSFVLLLLFFERLLDFLLDLLRLRLRLRSE